MPVTSSICNPAPAAEVKPGQMVSKNIQSWTKSVSVAIKLQGVRKKCVFYKIFNTCDLSHLQTIPKNYEKSHCIP